METPMKPGVGEFDPGKGGSPQGALCFTIYTSLSRKNAITVTLPQELVNGTVGQAIEYAVKHSKLTEDQKVTAGSITKIVYGGKEFSLSAYDGRNSFPVRKDSMLSGVPSMPKVFEGAGQKYTYRTVAIEVSQRVDGGLKA